MWGLWMPQEKLTDILSKLYERVSGDGLVLWIRCLEEGLWGGQKEPAL